jgi:hypothetical protein
MIATPADTPETMVPVMVTVAILVALLLHVPPEVTSFRGVVLPTHTDAVPVMDEGSGLTVTTEVTRQPLVSV